MTAAPLHILGERLMLDPGGVLLWPAAGLMVVSDLHLEKGSSFARKGMLLPPWDTQATLDRLALLLRRYKPAIVVALGDSFHDDAGAARLPAAELTRLQAMTRAHRFIWVLGNHDPTPPDGLGGEWVTEFTTHPLTFRHQAIHEAGPGEIVGHHHPKAAIPTRGTTVSRPCFVADARRVMMPAFGAYTGGLDVTDPAIAGLFPRGGRVFLLGKERLFSFALGPSPRRRAPAVSPA
jgi:DNA ligase-associated metallophosphoesterase